MSQSQKEVQLHTKMTEIILTSAGEDMGKLEPSYITGKILKLWKTVWQCLKRLKSYYVTQ